MKDKDLPYVLQGIAFDIEPVNGGFNLRLPKKKSEDKGPLIGWISIIACKDRPDIVKGFIAKVYDKERGRIIQRSYEMMAEELMNKGDNK